MLSVSVLYAHRSCLQIGKQIPPYDLPCEIVWLYGWEQRGFCAALSNHDPKKIFATTQPRSLSSLKDFSRWICLSRISSVSATMGEHSKSDGHLFAHYVIMVQSIEQSETVRTWVVPHSRQFERPGSPEKGKRSLTSCVAYKQVLTSWPRLGTTLVF